MTFITLEKIISENSVKNFAGSVVKITDLKNYLQYLKEKNASVQIIGCQPTEGSKIPGIRRWPVEYLPKIYDPKRVDRVMDISEQEARIMANRLAKEEAVFSGMSSGGAVSAAVKLAQELNEGIIVCIICDRGDRYLSSDLFGN